jgi:hypothetical protein
MLQVLFLCLAVQAGLPQVQVEVRGSEIWLTRGGHESQLTHDGKSKWQALLSPSHDRILYYEQCPMAEHCIPTIVILDLEGHRVTSFQPMHHAVPPVEPCGSINSLAWAGDQAVAADCHINPSLDEYIETDLATGQVIRDLLGADFTPSPAGKQVAHVGWYAHFAPPWAQSNYLQVDHATIYPLPKEMSESERKGVTGAPEVVRENGSRYSGIHEFLPGLYWSPDGERIALIDCTYDWTARHSGTLETEDGVASNRRCFVAVAALNGDAVTFPLTEAGAPDPVGMRPTWEGPRRLSFLTAGGTKTVTVP